MIDINPTYTNLETVTRNVQNDTSGILVESEHWTVNHRWVNHHTSQGFNVKLCNIPKCGQSTQNTQSINDDAISADRCIAFLREPLSRFRSCLKNCHMLFSDYATSNYNKGNDVMFHLLPQIYFVNAYPHEITEFHDISYMSNLYDASFTIQNPATYNEEWVEDFDITYQAYKNWFEDTYHPDIELYNSKILTN